MEETTSSENEKKRVKKESESWKEIKTFFKSKKTQKVLVILLLIGIIFIGTFIRVQNWNLLEDKTTGEKIPLALDPHYFLRIAQTMQESGEMPECDPLRVLGNECKGWSPEILPPVLVGMYGISNLFGDITLEEIDVIYPVIFFILSILVYFLLVSKLTKSKITALISSLILSLTPAFLYRTMAGFADHEAIGMFSFFVLLLGFAISLKYLNKNFDKINIKFRGNKLLYGVLTGFLIALTVACWGGIAKFSFMIIPLSILLFWFVKRKETVSLKKLFCIIGFYFTSIFSSLIFVSLISGYSFVGAINKNILNSNGLISLFVLGFLIIDFLMIYLKKKEILKVKNKYEVLVSFIILIFMGLVLLAILGEMSLITEVFEKILNPFGAGRVGETVAENKSPTLKSWMNQTGSILFWMFILGMIFIGKSISNKISEKKKKRNLFFVFWSIMIIGIIFSSHHVFDFSDFIKKFIYFGSVIAFVIYSVWLYGKENKFNVSTENIIIFSWLIFMLIAARGAVRLFFVITPFMIFMAGIVPVRIFNVARKNKDELIKTLSWVVLIAVIIGLVISSIGFYQSSMNQAKNTAPSANEQWQSAMKWIRENTTEDSVFLHWWDYGYWVQSLGKRATIVDGGYHPSKVVHMIGRYVLTTPNPESALSFMKSNNASYLLIDPTDIGKYGAYSRIGSGEEMKDRLSYIQTFNLDPRQTRETRNETMRIYTGGAGLDEDMVYVNKKGEKIFLPQGKAAIIGMIIKTEKEQGSQKLKQPEGVFYYNQKQYNLPIRYLYLNGEMIDFKNGINSTMRMVPSVSQSNQGVDIDKMGSVLYLSRKVSQSTVAQLYLMDDPFNRYSGLKLAHKEPSPVVQSLKMQGATIDDFIIYRGLRGPIKIWKAENIPEDIKVHEEFTQINPRGDDWEFGMLDELEYRE